MTDMTQLKPIKPTPIVERVSAELSQADLNDLCDSTDAAIEGGGGFGWVKLPSRDVLERYWQGVVAMPARILLVARLDNMICGTCQLIKPPINNEAQSHSLTLTTNFVAPWARGHGLASLLLETAAAEAKKEGFSVINLDVRETMQAAISLYETQNFVKCGENPYYAHVDGEFIKGFYFYKKL